MIASQAAATKYSGRRRVVSLASTVLLASGCSNMVSTAPGTSVDSAGAKVVGRIHGGNQPVSSATVNLYFAGQTDSRPPPPWSQQRSPRSTARAASPSSNSQTVCPTPASRTPSPALPVRAARTSMSLLAVATPSMTGDPLKNNSAAVFIAPVGRARHHPSDLHLYE